MKISSVQRDSRFIYAMVSTDEGDQRKIRVQRTTGAVQIEAHDQRRGSFWRRLRADMSEAIRIAIAETQHDDRLQSAIRRSKIKKAG